MKNLDNEIEEKLDLIKKMIKEGENRSKIETERKELDRLLEEFVKGI